MRVGVDNTNPMSKYHMRGFARAHLLLGCALVVTVSACSQGESTSSPAAGVHPVAATSERKGSVKLSWLASITNTDGSALNDLAGYKIYYGTSQQYFQHVIDIKDPTVTGYTIDNLPPYTYYSAITAYNVADTESSRSSIATKTVD